MRIDHLEAQLRDLTGTVEQLQHRNHELEQQLQQCSKGRGAQQTPRRRDPARNIRGAAGSAAIFVAAISGVATSAIFKSAIFGPRADGAVFAASALHTVVRAAIFAGAAAVSAAICSTRCSGTIAAAAPAGPPPDQAASPAVMATPSIPRPVPTRRARRGRLGARALQPQSLRPRFRHACASRQPGAPLDLSSAPDNGLSSQQAVRAATASDQSEFDRRHAGFVAAQQHAQGRIRSRLRLCAAQGLRPRRTDVARLSAQISE